MRLADVVLLVFLQTLWAGSYTAIKIALRELPIELLILLRYGSAALLLLAITTALNRHAAIARRDIKWIVLLGIIVFVLSPTLAFRGIDYSQAIDISILVSLEPLTTALLAFFILKERLDLRKGLSIVIAIPGVLLLSGIWNMQAGHFTPLRLLGNSLFILSLFCEGSHTVFGRALSRRYPPLTVSTYGFAAGFLCFAVLNWHHLQFFVDHSLSVQTWAALFYLAVLCSAFGYTAWFFVLKRLPANTIALTLYLQPVMGALISYLVLGEVLIGSAWLGAGLIIAAMTLAFYTPASKVR